MTLVHRLSVPALLAAVFFVSPLRAADQDDINKAIERGVARLKESQNFDGMWSYNGLPGESIGATALAALTLLECDVPSDDPAIQRAAKKIRDASVPLSHTYSLSLCILFLDRLGEKDDVPLIESLTARLLAGQNSTGGWSYTCPEPGQAEIVRLTGILRGKEEKKPPKKEEGSKPGSDDDKPLREKGEPESKPQSGRSPKEIQQQIGGLQRGGVPVPIAPRMAVGGGGMGTGDNSNTQFAVLALWVARRHGISVEKALARVETRFRKSQNADGGWSYMPAAGSMDAGFGQESTPAMTCAGLLGLAYGYGAGSTALKATDPKKKKPKEEEAKDSPPKEQPAGRDLNKDPHIKAGLKALGSVLGEPAAKGKKVVIPERFASPRGGNMNTSAYYTLWSVERVAVAYDLNTIGNKDWYGFGSDALLASEKEGGGWLGSYGFGVDTSFALLFLRRANLARDLTTVLKGRVHDPDHAGLKVGPGKSDAETKPEPKEEPSPKTETKRVEPAKEKPEVAKATPPAGAETEAARLTKELMQPNAAKQERAVAGLRDGKGADYTQALLKAIPKLEGDIKKTAREALAERMSRMTSATLRDRLQDGDPEMRRAAALAVAMKEDTAHVPRLIELVDDPEMSVSRAAVAALKSLSGTDLGPSKDASAAERAVAVAAWKKWWKEHGGK